MEEGLKFVLPKLGLIAFGLMLLICRKRIAKETSEVMRKDNLSKFGSFNYTEKYHLAVATGVGLMSVTGGIFTLLPLFDSTPGHLGGSVVGFIRVYLFIPILGAEFLVTFIYAMLGSRDEE